MITAVASRSRGVVACYVTERAEGLCPAPRASGSENRCSITLGSSSSRDTKPGGYEGACTFATPKRCASPWLSNVQHSTSCDALIALLDARLTQSNTMLLGAHTRATSFVRRLCRTGLTHCNLWARSAHRPPDCRPPHPAPLQLCAAAARSISVAAVRPAPSVRSRSATHMLRCCLRAKHPPPHPKQALRPRGCRRQLRATAHRRLR